MKVRVNVTRLEAWIEETLPVAQWLGAGLPCHHILLADFPLAGMPVLAEGRRLSGLLRKANSPLRTAGSGGYFSEVQPGAGWKVRAWKEWKL